MILSGHKSGIPSSANSKALNNNANNMRAGPNSKNLPPPKGGVRSSSNKVS